MYGLRAKHNPLESPFAKGELTIQNRIDTCSGGDSIREINQQEVGFKDIDEEM